MQMTQAWVPVCRDLGDSTWSQRIWDIGCSLILTDVAGISCMIVAVWLLEIIINQAFCQIHISCEYLKLTHVLYWKLALLLTSSYYLTYRRLFVTGSVIWDDLLIWLSGQLCWAAQATKPRYIITCILKCQKAIYGLFSVSHLA